MSTQYGDAGGSARAIAARLRKEAARLDAHACEWEHGACGEVATAEALLALPAEYVVLNDLPVPGSDSNVDHVVVGPTGVWVIDTKPWTGRITCNQDMLWRGQTPLHDELRTVKWLAGIVGDVGECKPRAVLCIGDASLPAPRQEVEKVLVVSRSHVASHIADSPVTLSAKQIDKTVDRLRDGMRGAELADAISKRRVARSRRPRRHGTVAVPLIRFLAIAAALIVGVPAALRLLDSPEDDGAAGAVDDTAGAVDDAATRSSRRPAAAVTSTVPPATTVAAAPTTVASPLMPVDAVLATTFACPGPGQGWTMSWSWPGPTLPAGHAYLYEWHTGDTWIRSGLTSAPDDGGAVALANVGPGASYFVRLSVVEGVPERSSAYVESLVVAPTEPC